MSKVTTILQYIITAIGTIAGLYATVKLGIYGMAHMEKNPQKVEQARDGFIFNGQIWSNFKYQRRDYLC